MKTTDRAGSPGFIYARISSVYGERESSLDTQHDRCARVGEVEKIVVPPDYVLKERDSGHETIDTRKELLRARELAREGKIGWGIIDAWDRLSRTPEELVSVWQEFRRHGVTIICRTSPLHHMDLDQAKLNLRMLGIMGEMELNYVRRRTTDNKRAMRQAGRRVGEGGPVYGYEWLRRKDGKIDESRAWIVVAAEAEVILLIFEWIGDQGWSLNDVVEELNRRGVPTPAASAGRKFKDGRRLRWSRNIAKMIADPTYKGVTLCGRTRPDEDGRYLRVPAGEQQVLDRSPTPAIVPADLWDRANLALAARRSDPLERARRAAQTRNRLRPAFFRGIIRCACCGGPMRMTSIAQWNPTTGAHDGPPKIAYRCERRWDRTRPPEERACAGRTVYEHKVYEEAWRIACEALLEAGWLEKKYEALKAERPGEELLRESLVVARQELARTERRIANVIDQMADAEHPADRADLKLKLADLRREKAGYEGRVANLEDKLQGYDLMDRRYAELLANRAAIRSRLMDPDRTAREDRRKILEGIHASFLGSGEELKLSIDMNLRDVTPEGGPLVVEGASTRRSIVNEQRLTLTWTHAELLARVAVTV